MTVYFAFFKKKNPRTRRCFSSPQTASVKTTLRFKTQKQQMTFHCQQCNAVLADSTGVCGEMKSMDSLMCLITNDVVINRLIMNVLITPSIYSSLKCRGCRCALGKVIHSAPSRLALIRSIFLLYKANINCYILNSSSLVKASTLTFDQKPLRQSMNEVGH
uniref:Protein yippee-like n=1 Tax=Astatotilapia calliptera TaxID=8154 RepID=A0AAX7SW26_ASTCA